MLASTVVISPGIEALEHYTTRARSAYYVSLQGYRIGDLVPFMAKLEQLPNMAELNLANNQLWRLPENMSGLKQLTSLDLSFNQFQSAAMLLNGLASLPKLVHLKVNLLDVEEEILVAKLSKLKTFNGVLIDVESERANLAATGSVMVDDRSGQVRLPGEAVALSNAELIERIQLGDVVAVGNQQVKSLRAQRGYDGVIAGHPVTSFPFEPWTNERTRATRAMYDACAAVSGPLANPAEFEELQRLILTHMKAKVQEDRDPIRQQVHQFHAGSLLLEYCFEEVARASTKYDVALSQSLRALFAEMGKQFQTASTIFSALQEDRDRKMLALQRDLARELLVNHALARPDGAEPEDEFRVVVGRMAEDAAEAASPTAGNLNDISSEAAIAALRRQLDALFASKVQHTEVNKRAKLPSETMEQHMYTFFSRQGSGDRDAVKAQVREFVEALRTHRARHNIDAEVFSSILCFDVDEDYWRHHCQLQEQVFQTVFSVLQSDGVERGSPALVLDGRVTEREAVIVAQRLLPATTDFAALLKRFKLRLRSSTMGYRDLAKLICKFELDEHIKRVRPWVASIRLFDKDRGGVLDSVQVRMLLSQHFPGLSSVEEKRILSLLDPFQHNVMLFSDILRVFLLTTGNAPTAGSSAADSSRSEAAENVRRLATPNVSGSTTPRRPRSLSSGPRRVPFT